MTLPPPRLAILVKGWPRLSETFIAQELVALERAGVSFDLWSLRHPTDKKTHPLHDALQAQVFYLPEYLHEEPWRVLKGLGYALTRAGFGRSFGLFLKDLRRDVTRNRVRRFGQACVLAREMSGDIRALYAHFLHTPSSVARYASAMTGTPWSFAAHAKDIWTSPDWELQEKLNDKTVGAAFGATCTALNARHLNGLSTHTPVHLVYHGLDLSRFPEPPDRPLRDARAPFRMVSVGRLVEKKGFDRLLDAFARLPNDLDWHWEHIGGGELQKTLQQKAKDLGLSARISWRGALNQPEVIAAMRGADLFVLPSRIAKDGDRDGLPNVLMEAASQKLAILSTPVSAIPEFVDTGVHGLLTDDVPEALAAAITDMASDPAQAAAMAEAAYARLTAEFMMQPGIDRLAVELRALVDGAA